MQNKINLPEEKMLYPNNVDEEFINVQLPISLHEDLQLFEEQLDEERFKNKVISIFCLLFFYFIYIIIYLNRDIYMHIIALLVKITQCLND